MTNLLIINLETTGPDPEQHHPIELGAVFYSVKNHCALHRLSTLLPIDHNPTQAVNHINADASYAALDQFEALMTIFATMGC